MFFKDKKPDRFDKFTDKARKVLALAQEEAQRFQHNYIGTEHLLLGLVRLEDDPTRRIFTSLGVQLEKVRSAVEFIIGRGDPVILGEMGLTPRSKKVIELAVEEAQKMRYPMVGPEHLLLGLVAEGSGIAAGVMESMGIKLDNLRAVVQEHITPALPMLDLARSYLSGERENEQVRPGAQDADDLVPAAVEPIERGNRFTIRARRVLRQARLEALCFGQTRVGTEHILLALVHEEAGLACRVLNNLGISRERIIKATEFLISEEHLSEPGDNPVMSADCLHAINLALDEAQMLHPGALGSEHLLLGLLRGEGIASGVLRTRGLKLEAARAELQRLLGM